MAFRSIVAASAVVLLAGAAQGGVTFNVTYDASYDLAAIPTTNAALAQYGALFSDNVVVSLKLKYTGAGLGTTGTYSFQVPYADYRAALAADATSAVDATALAHLPGGATNPVNGSGMVTQGRAGFAAVGINIDTSGIPGYYDGEIDLNLGAMNYTRSTIDPDKYDLQGVLQHEVDEVMGSISAVGQADPRPSDLFRYTAAGARTFTTVGNDAYFSLDGTTKVGRFNQNPDGDYGDWYSDDSDGPHTLQVQDAFATPGQFADLGAEITVLDAVGWTRVPAPASLALLGMGGLMAARRRRA